MKLFVFLLLFVAVCAKHEKYAGYKSYYVGPQTQEQLKALSSITQKLKVVNLGHTSVGRDGLFLVKPESQAGFTKSLKDLGIPYRIHSEDVAKALQNDDRVIEEVHREKLARNGGARIPYDNYQPLDVYDSYLKDIAGRFPNLVKLVTPANSFEGRPINYLKISSTDFEDTSKPIIFIEGTIHAREWIAPPTVAWAIRKLVEDVTEPDLLENFDWILMPIANPDGYEYTHVEDRFWRKTMSNNTYPVDPVCWGVDGNRNYDFAWNTIGVSQNPCDETYPGTYAFSEVETRVIRDIVLENQDRMAMYFSMHSAGSMFVYPWAHNASNPDNFHTLHEVAMTMANAVNAHKLTYFPTYQVGNVVVLIGYEASGSSNDYVRSIGVPLAYTIELPGLETGFEMFNLHPNFIEQVCRETWEGIVAGARSIKSSSSTTAASFVTFLIISLLGQFLK